MPRELVLCVQVLRAAMLVAPERCYETLGNVPLVATEVLFFFFPFVTPLRSMTDDKQDRAI